MKPMLYQDQVAEMLNVTTHSLYVWRKKGIGPVYVKLNGRTVRYRQEDVEEWIKSKTVQTNRRERLPVEGERVFYLGRS